MGDSSALSNIKGVDNCPRTNVLGGGGGYYGLLESIASIFYIYIDIGEWIAGNQDGPCLIIRRATQPPPPPKLALFSH